MVYAKFGGQTECIMGNWKIENTAISRKVVGKSTRDNAERYCGWFSVHCHQRNLQEWN